MGPSTSPSSRGGGRGPSLAVIDTPAAPPGWEGARSRLVRIVDPLGRAVAWLAPDHGGRCVGFAVRPSGERGTAWAQLLRAAPPAGAGPARDEAGQGIRCTFALGEGDGPSDRDAVWRFVERDPTAATLAADIARGGEGGDLRLRFSATLADGALALTLLAENGARRAVDLRLGLEFTLDGELFGAGAGTPGLILPDPPDPPGRGDGGAVSRVARLGTAESPLGAILELRDGASLLRRDTPGAPGTIALVAAIGERPEGMVTVEAGGAVALAAVLSVAPNQPAG